MSFQIHALPADSFQALFDLPEEELRRREARREVVRTKPGTPCRISLEDAEIGEEVVLVHYEHQPARTPFRAGHAIFVRRGVPQARPGVGEIPPALQARLISIRAFDASHQMRGADVAQGAELAPAILRLLADESVAYLHLHNAKPGCYAARVTRA